MRGQERAGGGPAARIDRPVKRPHDTMSEAVVAFSLALAAGTMASAIATAIGAPVNGWSQPVADHEMREIADNVSGALTATGIRETLLRRL